jgi:hypothetical protein
MFFSYSSIYRSFKRSSIPLMFLVGFTNSDRDDSLHLSNFGAEIVELMLWCITLLNTSFLSALSKNGFSRPAGRSDIHPVKISFFR